jgi:hypothetical protein
MRTFYFSKLFRTPANLVASFLVVIAMAACADAVHLQTSNDMQIDPGVLGTFRYASGGRDMYVRILSNPYSIPDGEFGQAVTNAMEGHNNGPRTNFVSEKTETVRDGYEIVMWFGPTGGVNSGKMCAMDATNTKQSGDRLYALAVFCAPGRAMSWASANIRFVETPNDPLFEKMIAQVTRGLIPNRDSERSRRTWF